MYRVIGAFADLTDDNHVYEVGDKFPRDGAKVSRERIAALLGSENRQHKPLIEKVEDKAEEKTPGKKRTKRD